MSEVPVVYAGFWRRAGALLTDVLVSTPIFALQFALFRASTASAILGLLVPGVALAFYPAFFHARWGQTLGKMATRIKVVQLNGDSITIRHALLRSSVDLTLWLIYTVTTVAALVTRDGPEWSSLSWLNQQEALREGNIVFGVYNWLSQAWMWSEVVVLLFNRKRRALHDFIAATIVVRVKEQRAFDLPPPMVPGQSANA